MEFSEPIFVAVFIIIVAYAIFARDPLAIGMVGGVIAVIWGRKTGSYTAPSRLVAKGFDLDLAGRGPEKFGEAAPTSAYPGAVDSSGDGPAGQVPSGPETNVLQADEEYVRLTRARDQLPVRAQTGIYQRRDMMANVLDDELRVAEDRVWWGRADA